MVMVVYDITQLLLSQVLFVALLSRVFCGIKSTTGNAWVQECLCVCSKWSPFAW